MTDFQDYRIKMVDGQLRTNEVTDHHILESFLTMPKELFVPSQKKNLAYLDADIQLKSASNTLPARYILHSMPLARLVQALDLHRDDVVLDIGCGFGYSTAIMSNLVSSVIGLEDDSFFVDRATEALSEADCDNTVIIEGSLTEGVPSEGPFDAILINGAVDFIPDTLFDQLSNGGRLAVIMGQGGAAQGCVFTKNNASISKKVLFNYSAPCLKAFEKEAAFEF